MDAAEGCDWSVEEWGIVLFLPMFGKMLWPLKPRAPIMHVSRSSKAPSQHTSWKDGPLYSGCFGAAVQVFYTTVVFPVIKTLTYFQSAGKQPNLQALEVHYHFPGYTRQRRPWLKLIWSWPGSHVPTSLLPSLPPSLSSSQGCYLPTWFLEVFCPNEEAGSLLVILAPTGRLLCCSSRETRERLVTKQF